jgi:hypothetical protein
MPPQKPLPEPRAADRQVTCSESQATSLTEEALVGFSEAARILSMSERNLRKIIRRSRERIAGRRTSGPVIRFFQCHPKAAVKFRRSWLDEFIRENSHDPRKSPSLLPPESPRRKKKSTKRGYGSQVGSSEMAFGFDSELYEL